MTITKETKFWVVTIPTKESTLQDICFECDLKGLALQFKGGLSPDDIIGMYPSKENARYVANNELNKK